jgi:Ca-activated chloride channel family protein
MFWMAGLLWAFLSLQALPAPAPEAPQHPVFSVSVDLVKIPVSVFDEHGAPVHDLLPRDFRVFEDGIRQEIRSIGMDENPLSAALVIDTSATVKKEMDEIKEAAEDFTNTLSRDDKVAIITFDDEAKQVLDWTSDKKQVRKAIRRLEAGIRTALYDAMYFAAAEQLRGIEGRKAIILLTDGLNNQSSVTFQQAALVITQSQASLYVVSKTAIVRQAARTQRRVVMLSGIYRKLFGEEDYIEQFFRKIEGEMTELAEKTGGRCYFPKEYSQIPGAYSEVARDLKNKYFLTYVSNQKKASNSYHQIDLEYLLPCSKLSYRRGYYHQPDPVLTSFPRGLQRTQPH